MLALKSEAASEVQSPTASHPNHGEPEAMAEATSSISQSPTIRITTAAHALAQLRARQAVKRQLQAQGLKVAHYAARDITILATQYLNEHRAELMPDAIASARAMILSGAFGKRAQRALCAKLESDAQTQKA
jgi:hypothetical protein